MSMLPVKTCSCTVCSCSVTGMMWVCQSCKAVVCPSCAHLADISDISLSLMLRLKSEPAPEGKGNLLNAFFQNPRSVTTLYRNMNDAAVYNVAHGR